jgi:heme exporter protein D
MSWSSVSEFAAMGGYGLYVWGAFGVTALVMLGEVLSLRARRKALREIVDEPSMHADYRKGAA